MKREKKKKFEFIDNIVIAIIQSIIAAGILYFVFRMVIGIITPINLVPKKY